MASIKGLNDPNGGIRKSSEVELSAGQVLAIGPSAIHAVGCASVEPCCGIHVYLGALKVFFQAKEQGVVGIHFDECQHIFSGKSASVRKIILDSFKSLLKRTDWPLMLILSGVNELTEYVSEEEQLSYLLRPVVFAEIRPNNTVDLKEISDLCHLYVGKVGIDFPEKPWTSDFTKRLAFCSANRWGLLIELVIDALKIAHLNDAAQVDTEHFCKSFTDRTGFAAGHSPISIEYYEEAFDTQKILDMVRRSEVAGKSEDRKRRPK